MKPKCTKSEFIALLKKENHSDEFIKDSAEAWDMAYPDEIWKKVYLAVSGKSYYEFVEKMKKEYSIKRK